MEKELQAVAQVHQLYILNDRFIPKRCSDPVAWIEWMTREPLPVLRTVLQSGRVLRTTFAGYAGGRRESQPLTFCTMFKPEAALPEFSVPLEWHMTWKEAEAAHARYVDAMNKSLPSRWSLHR